MRRSSHRLLTETLRTQKKRAARSGRREAFKPTDNPEGLGTTIF
jgi:hypothetical protein